MRTDSEIAARLKGIDEDERYHCPCADIFSNAPLALIQMGMESEARALAWVLQVDPPKFGPRKKTKVRGGTNV